MLGTSWKTSVVGWIIIVGDVVAFLVDVIQKQGLPDTVAEWVMFPMGLATGLVAILAKDRDVTGGSRGAPTVLGLGIVSVMLVSCASYVDIGNGRVMKTVVTEERSPFGTNAGFMQLQECEKVLVPGNTKSYDYINCVSKSAWVPINSQGQGGQIVGGALTGLGAGIGGAMVDTGSTVIQSVTSGKGH